MHSDILQLLVDFVNGSASSFTKTIFSVTSVIALIGFIVYLAKARTSREASIAKIFFYLVLTLFLINLHTFINAGEASIGFSSPDWSDISYIHNSSFKEFSEVANAVLTVLRIVGLIILIGGINKLKRSQLDGHTGLSKSDDIGSGIVKILVGLMLICNPQLLTAIQNSLNIHF